LTEFEILIKNFVRRSLTKLISPSFEIRLYKILETFIPFVDRVLSSTAKIKLYTMLTFITPLSPEKIQISKILAKEGVAGVRNAYRENLELVLNYVKQLVAEIPSGKIIITADHGEWLGEDGRYGHALMEVPWLEIKK